MPSVLLKNCAIYVGPYDLTADHNQVDVSQDVEELDDTRFGPVLAKALTPGLRSATLAAKAFWEADGAAPKLDDKVSSLFPQSGWPLSVIAQNAGAAGEVGYAFQAMAASLKRGAQVGQLLMVDLQARNTAGPLVRATVLETGTKAVAGNGTARQLGAVTSAQRVYVALHAFAVTGGTLTVKVQSDDASGFSTPTDRVTLAALTQAGSEWKELAGPVTDTWWRANWSLSAGSASFALLVGIL
jgi:hypothetical protein